MASASYSEGVEPVADTPVRVLSLEPWGHKRTETGGVSNVGLRRLRLQSTPLPC